MGHGFEQAISAREIVDTVKEDHISELPDDVLISILSRLPHREAARSSILSRRWRDTWTWIDRLVFVDEETENAILKIKYDYPLSRELRDSERNKYARWIDQVMDSHKGFKLEEFKVQFDFDQSWANHIGRWIEYAFKKRVSRLDIDLKQIGFTFRPEYYKFSHRFVRSPLGLSCIKYLRSLRLVDVNISRELVEHFLANCPMLERLAIDFSQTLSNFKVVGSSLQLKRLEILWCPLVQNIEICAPKLVSFSFIGEKINFQIENIPLLADLSIGVGGIGNHISNAVGPFLNYFSQLETLKFKLRLSHQEQSLKFQWLPQLAYLRQLMLEVWVYDAESLLCFSPLMKASPLLSKFRLELTWTRKPTTGNGEVKRGIKCPHQCLKVVEIVGFYGGRIDTEIALFFIENAVMLETIMVDPREPFYLHRPADGEEKKRARRARRLLEKELPPGAQLIVVP